MRRTSYHLSLKPFLKFLLITVLVAFQWTAQAQFPRFDRGPDPADPMQRELVKILQEMPYLPGISDSLQVLTPEYQKGQKIRLDFGAMPLRGFLTPNSISTLIIGQDGTHIAEGANRPGIAGFGGRVQDILMHFGIFEGVLFTNLYVNTITGQYGSANTPMIQTDADGKAKLVQRSFIENRLWLMTHEGPYLEWRNRLLGWIIRNNKDSLKMVLLLGKAGRDAGAAFIRSIGGEIPPVTSEQDAANLKVPWFKMVSAGGNNEWAVPVDKDGKDIAETLLGKSLDYSEPADQKAATAVLTDKLDEAMKLMVFTRGGPKLNGALRTEQFGGFNLKMMTNNGEHTQSIKGLKIPDGKGGSIVAPDVVFSSSPHPTMLSMSEQEEKGSAAKMVEEELLEPLKREMQRGWVPPQPEPGLESEFLKGGDYKYGRAVIPRSHGDPGITDDRLLPVSDAVRDGKNVIIIGTRDKAPLDKEKIKEMSKSMPSQQFPEKGRVLTGRPQFTDWLFRFDRGPSDAMADLLFNDDVINKENLFGPKEGMSFANDGIAALNVKTHPDAGLFGHYRGTFENPRVLILADPDGVDSFVTSKAATGARGQYLQGLMEDLGVGSQYLVLNTVPVGMDGANDSEWQTVLKQTESYRENLIRKVLENGRPEMILADGPNAAREINRILGKVDIPVINIDRGSTADYGIKAAGLEINKLEAFKAVKINGRRLDIPREHLTWVARVWEGTGGERVITAEGKKYEGKAFAIVVPDWARKHEEVVFPEKVAEAVKALIFKLEKAGEPLPKEKIVDFVERRKGFKTEWELAEKRGIKKDADLNFVKNLLTENELSNKGKGRRLVIGACEKAASGL